MLTAKQIDSLKPGEYPNHVLRMKFGNQHGTPVRERYIDHNGEIKETTIIGNRSQSRFRIRNPFGRLPDYSKPKFQGSRLENKENKDKKSIPSILSRAMAWLFSWLSKS